MIVQPQDIQNASSKSDNRGQHWKHKVSQGQAPEPWKHTQYWAERRAAKESEFEALLRERKIEYTLPWRKANSPSRVMGNTNKVLFIELMSHHYNGVAVLTFVDTTSACFLGIACVRVSSEQRAAFDASLIPSVDGRRRMEAGIMTKTLVKIWHTAGFVERALEGGALQYDFDQATFDRMKAQAHRADEKRRHAAKSPEPAPAPPVAGTPMVAKAGNDDAAPAAMPTATPAALIISAAALQPSAASAPMPCSGLGPSTQEGWQPAPLRYELSAAGAAHPALPPLRLPRAPWQMPPLPLPPVCEAAEGAFGWPGRISAPAGPCSREASAPPELAGGIVGAAADPLPRLGKRPAPPEEEESGSGNSAMDGSGPDSSRSMKVSRGCTSGQWAASCAADVAEARAEAAEARAVAAEERAAAADARAAVAAARLALVELRAAADLERSAVGASEVGRAPAPPPTRARSPPPCFASAGSEPPVRPGP